MARRIVWGRDGPKGRPGRVAGTYEKTVSGLPYVIAYELDDTVPDAPHDADRQR